jgi:D-alanyl-D-alanine carboxypeptidase
MAGSAGTGSVAIAAVAPISAPGSVLALSPAAAVQQRGGLVHGASSASDPSTSEKDKRKATTLTISSAETSVAKNKSVKLTAKLARSGKAYANKKIQLQYRAHGSKKWVTLDVKRTSNKGTITFTSKKLTKKTQFRATFAGTKTYRPATSKIVSVGIGNAARKLPQCAVRDVNTKHRRQSDWARTLVDHEYKLPKSYRPKDLVPVSRAGISGSGSIRKIVIKDLKAMTKAASKAGAPITVRSAYRSYATQQSTFKHWVRVNGKERALRVSARPGHSEHQLGTALDFNTKGARTAPWVGDWGTTTSGAWMKKNAWKYGFVMSYPAGRTKETCYGYEPWHYRYVGKEAAQEIRDRGITLREYLWERQ